MKEYYYLTKPGLVRGNVILTAAGFLFATRGTISIYVLLITLIGIALVIASGCVFNNIIDKDIDKLMKRTEQRALVTGKISQKNAVIFGTIVGIVGISLLAWYTNFITTLCAVIGFVVYVVAYSFLKHRSSQAALVGTIAGAMPIVVGYTAVTKHFDLGAVLLFVILIFWQMAHFYAVAIYRLSDYQAAAIPVMPVKKSVLLTKIQILMYITLFTGSTMLLTLFGFTRYFYAITMLLLELYWFIMAIRGFSITTDNTQWARKLFLFSLIMIMYFSIIISLSSLLNPA